MNKRHRQVFKSCFKYRNIKAFNNNNKTHIYTMPCNLHTFRRNKKITYKIFTPFLIKNKTHKIESTIITLSFLFSYSCYFSFYPFFLISDNCLNTLNISENSGPSSLSLALSTFPAPNIPTKSSILLPIIFSNSATSLAVIDPS